MREFLFKRSAIHNLLITECQTDFVKHEVAEGLVVPKDILARSDILPWEQVIATKIRGNNWINRIKTFVIPGENNGKVEARGSLARFLEKGELTCLISRTFLDEEDINLFKRGGIPILDLGFDPGKNRNNLIGGSLYIEYENKKEKAVKNYQAFAKRRSNLRRIFLSSLILNLRINKTHADCLQGSAELPRSIMAKAKLRTYQAVSVYNSSEGGIADTYVVPVPPKVVMTTGAMAKFARIGEKVNVATYVSGTESVSPVIITTNGSEFMDTLRQKPHVVKQTRP